MNNPILDHAEVDRLIGLALEEDGVARDLTTEALETALAGARKGGDRATIVARGSTVAAGFPVVGKIVRLAGAERTLRVSSLVPEGAALGANSPWIILEGEAPSILRLERVILNFLMRMSGIAEHTRKVVAAVAGTGCRVLHTRKTAPGHRRTDVYAALTGGAHPHRRSLDEAVLVKENHLRAAPSFQALMDGIAGVRSRAAFVEIEVTDFTELKHALLAKPNRILLDNFAIENVRRAADLYGGSVELEASGGINLDNAKAYAETGIDFISMGSLTHSSAAADLSLLFDHK